MICRFLDHVQKLFLHRVVVNAERFSRKLLLGEGLEVIYSSYPIIKHECYTSLDSGCYVTLFLRQISLSAQRDRPGKRERGFFFFTSSFLLICECFLPQ